LENLKWTKNNRYLPYLKRLDHVTVANKLNLG
jgi:hypothetical protein